MRVRTAVVLVTLAALVTLTAAASTVWVKLGKRTVDFRTDHDTIRVGASKGRFRAIRIHVYNHPVRMLDLKIRFKDGTVQDVSLRSVIPAGQHSRIIDLRGGPRVISKVEFTYRSTGPAPRPRPRRGRPVALAKARVEVWGLR